MAIDDFARRVFAAAAAARDRQVGLDFAKRLGSAVYDLADLAIANGSTNADVHTDT